MISHDPSLVTALMMIIATFVAYLAGFAMLNAAQRRPPPGPESDESRNERPASRPAYRARRTFPGPQRAWEHTPY